MASNSKILLVDDDPTVLDLVRETLEGCGYDIDTATNSQEALSKVRDGAYAMIIVASAEQNRGDPRWRQPIWTSDPPPTTRRR